MSRALSTAGKVAIHGRTPGDGEILLIRIAHADITTLRYAQAPDDVSSGGSTYTARSFALLLPTDEDGVGATTLSLGITDLADATVAALVGAAGARPTVSVDLVLESDPDTVEATFYFEMRDADAGLGDLRATLTYEPMLSRPFPGYFYDAATYPLLFGGAS